MKGTLFFAEHDLFGKPVSTFPGHALFFRHAGLQRQRVQHPAHLVLEGAVDKLVLLDPRFALAHGRLAEILSGLYDNFDHRPSVLAEARSHAEEALERNHLDEALASYRSN